MPLKYKIFVYVIPILLGVGIFASIIKDEATNLQAQVVTVQSTHPVIASILEISETIKTADITTTTSTTAAPTTTTTQAKVVTQSVQQALPPPVSEAPAGEIESLILAKWGPEHGPKAVSVARCESGLRPNATNGVHAGLFQISGRWHKERVARMGYSWEQMFEAGPNIEVAYAIWAEQGWRPWSCA